jgi:hypothetical protein
MNTGIRLAVGIDGSISLLKVHAEAMIRDVPALREMSVAPGPRPFNRGNLNMNLKIQVLVAGGIMPVRVVAAIPVVVVATDHSANIS